MDSDDEIDTMWSSQVPLTEDGRFHFHPDELEAVLHAVRSGKDIEVDRRHKPVLLSITSTSIPSITITSHFTDIGL